MPEKRPCFSPGKPVPFNSLDYFSDRPAQTSLFGCLSAEELPNADKRLNEKRGFDKITAVIVFRKGYCFSARCIDEVRKGAVKTLHSSQRFQHTARARNGVTLAYPHTMNANDEREETKPDTRD